MIGIVVAPDVQQHRRSYNRFGQAIPQEEEEKGGRHVSWLGWQVSLLGVIGLLLVHSHSWANSWAVSWGWFSVSFFLDSSSWFLFSVLSYFVMPALVRPPSPSALFPFWSSAFRHPVAFPHIMY